ncbi:6-phosphogluconolactonase [Pseudomaricurvus sp.]|uniref:6-phosphogluconolactonase n=1 Tax=Pseudomaricurvus sp. TaxID=2004510 RepID=UPI003F6B39AA
MINEYRFESREALLNALYDDVMTCLSSDLQEKGQATALLSGGSTPGPLYERLSHADLEWSNIHVALVDERWVEPDHAASNEKLLKNTLLQNKAASAQFAGMKNAANTPFEGQSDCNRQYDVLPAPYSVCLLGMGGDGHTASLFPHAEGLTEALDSQQLCAGILANKSEVTGDNLARMTMTPFALLKSRKIVLLITGDDKWIVYRQARENSEILSTPVSVFLQQNDVDIDVYWAP